MPINIGLQESLLSVSVTLPAAGNNTTSSNIDLQAVGPFSAADRLGLFQVSVPAIVGNTTGSGITIAMQVAEPSLTLSPVAPGLPVAGSFAAPNPSSTVTVAAVASTGSAAGYYYFQLPLDGNGNVYQFYNFLVTVPSGPTTASEVVTIAFINRN